jgi:hypothetical protein
MQKLSLYAVVEDLDAVTYQGFLISMVMRLLVNSFLHNGPSLRTQDVTGQLLSVTLKKLDHPSPILVVYGLYPKDLEGNDGPSSRAFLQSYCYDELIIIKSTEIDLNINEIIYYNV